MTLSLSELEELNKVVDRLSYLRANIRPYPVQSKKGGTECNLTHSNTIDLGKLNLTYERDEKIRKLVFKLVKEQVVEYEALLLKNGISPEPVKDY